jgi:hypothetical protein
MFKISSLLLGITSATKGVPTAVFGGLGTSCNDWDFAVE